MIKALLLALCGGMVALAAPPTITCTGTDPYGQAYGPLFITPTSAFVYCSISAANHYIRIEYDTDSGAPYANRTHTPLNQESTIKLSIGGLTPSTTYYARAVGHPNASNLTDVGYSSEFTFTTSATGSAIVNPTPPAEWVVPDIDTSGYTTVVMKVCGSGYWCVSAAVGPHAFEDSLQTAINNASYGTVFQFPRATAGNVQHDTGTGNRGYTLPAKAVVGSIDDPAHPWIVFETEGCSNTAHFPPFGSRIDSQSVSKLATLNVTAFATQYGQHFDSSDVSSHHYAWRCLNLATPAGAAVDVVNPQAYRHFIYVSRNFTPTAVQKYFLIDRVYANGVGGTKRQYGGIHLGASYSAIIGSDIRTGTWRMYDWPRNAPTAGGTGTRTLTIPSSSTYRLRSTDTAIGMASGGSVTVTSLGSTGTWMLTLSASGGKFYFDNRAVSASCTNCTAIGSASDPVVANPSTEYLFAYGTFSSAGAITITESKIAEYQYYPYNGASHDNIGFSIQIGSYNPGPFVFRNNYIETTGLGLYADGASGGAEYDPNDGVVWHNWFNVPSSRQHDHPNTDGYQYDNRNMFELKRGRRWSVIGNRFSGNIAQQNAGAAIFLSGRPSYFRSGYSDVGNGISDIVARSNSISRGPAGWDCSPNVNGYTDPTAPVRILFENNLLFALDRFAHETGLPGKVNASSIAQPYFSNYGGCQDVTIRKNTFGDFAARAPVWFIIGGDNVRSGKFKMVDNVVYYGQGVNGHGVLVDSTATNATYPRLPADAGSTLVQKLDDYFSAIGSGATTPTHDITNNLIIGGSNWTSSTVFSDLSQSTITTYAAAWPSGNTWTAGATKAARETAAGFTSAATYDYRLLSTSPYYRAASDKFSPIGADIDVLKAEQGIVQDISVVAGYQSITARYLAPDSRACSLDSSSDSGATWTRSTDAGGSRQRVNSVAGLTAATAYTWRLMCYAAQTNDGRQWDDWPASQITTGSVTTAASSTMTLAVSYSLNVTGATKARVTVYKADGTSAQTTCSSSPCSVAFTKDAAEFMMEKLSAGDVVLSAGARQKIVVQ